jgi:hypothetical protein
MPVLLHCLRYWWGKGPSLQLPGGLSWPFAVLVEAASVPASRVTSSGADGVTRLCVPQLSRRRIPIFPGCLPARLPRTGDVGCDSLERGIEWCAEKTVVAQAEGESCRWWRKWSGHAASPSRNPVRAEVAALGPPATLGRPAKAAIAGRPVAPFLKSCLLNG